MTEAITLPSHIITMKKNHTQLDMWPHLSSKGFFLEMVAALSIPVCFWGLIGNATVFWLLCSRVKKTTFIVYALNLIIADFIVAVYFFTVFTVFLASVYISFYFSRLMENMYSLSSNASLSFVTALCTERYFMVFFPLRYQHHRPKGLTKKVCCIIWLWSCLVALILYVACYPKLFSVLSPGNSLCEGALIFESLIHLAILFPIMAFSALSLFIRMWKRGKQRTKSRLDITLTTMAVLHFICIYILKSLYFMSNWVNELREPTLFHVSLLFDSIETSIGPLVYFFIGNQQRQTAEPMYKLLERAFKY